MALLDDLNLKLPLARTDLRHDKRVQDVAVMLEVALPCNLGILSNAESAFEAV